MRFQHVPFGGRAPKKAAACDGLVAGAAIDLSHWSHNRTPTELKRDTSVEIALEFVKQRPQSEIEVVANNHFDTDGVLAVWTLLSPEIARAHADLIIAAAESGDFSEWPKDDRGLHLDLAIEKLTGDADDGHAYARILPMLDTLVPSIGAREDLWGPSYRTLADGEAPIARGRIVVSREGRIALYRHVNGEPELAGAWIARLRPPETDRVLLAFEEEKGAFRYRYELPRYAWADTVLRPRLPMPKRGPIRRTLGDAWVIKGRKGMTGIAYTSRAIASDPSSIARALDALEA